MNENKCLGVGTVKMINPKSLTDMEDDEIIVVNLVQISSKIVEYEIKNVHSTNLSLLKQTFKVMKAKERVANNAVFGAEMYVKDVRDIFPEYESLPKNSFVFSIKKL